MGKVFDKARHLYLMDSHLLYRWRRIKSLVLPTIDTYQCPIIPNTIIEKSCNCALLTRLPTLLDGVRDFLGQHICASITT